MKVLTKRSADSNFPRRIFSKLQFFQAFLIVAALMASGFVARHFFKTFFIDQVHNQLKDTLALMATKENWAPGQMPPLSWCSDQAKGTNIRVTIIDLDGFVHCDSHMSPQGLDNHQFRPEIKMAQSQGEGYDIRKSVVLGQDLIYGAKPLPNGMGYLRVALSLSILKNALHAYDVSSSLILAVLAMLLFSFGYWSSQQMIEPVFGEWSELEKSIDKIGQDLERTSESLSLEREELATLMAGISDGVLAIDVEGKPLFFNSRFALLLKVRGLREERPHYSQVFMANPELVGAFDRALADGKATHLDAVPFQTDTGKRYFSLSVSPLQRRKNLVYGAVGLFHDVTELKLAEQIRIDFVANVSHELRTPLTSIQGYTETLLDDLKRGRSLDAKFLEIINRNANRLLSLIDDLLDISALESTTMALKKEDIDIEAFSNKVLTQFAQKLTQREQKVRVEASVAKVEADPKRLEQVLINLLDNAHKFSPEKGEIIVKWEPSSDKKSVLMRVIDSGPGIPPEHHSRLFERFYRVDKARSREIGGTGLGLSIVKHIMLGHHGSVNVSSAPGYGAIFTCAFPNESTAPLAT